MDQEEKQVVVRPKVNEALVGIAEDKATQLRKVFIPMLETLDGFEEDYNKILELEINEETCKLAKRLRLDIAKIRTNASKAKKDQKAEFIRAGKAVDGIFHIVEYAVVSKEEKLKEIETHHERIEEERKDKLAVERIELLKEFDVDGSTLGLGEMSEAIWNGFYSGTKTNYETAKEAAIKAEEERQDRERKTKLNTQRKLQCSRLVDFIPDFATRDLSDLSEEEYKTLTDGAVKKRDAHNAEQERIRRENEDLKAEADRKEKIRLKEESDRKAKKEKEANELEEKKKSNINKYSKILLDSGYKSRVKGVYVLGFYRVTDSQLETLTEKEFNQRLSEVEKNHKRDLKVEEDRILAEEKNQTKLDEEKRISDEKLENERKENRRIQKKLDDEKELKKKIKLEEAKRLRDERMAPDKEKLRKILLQFDGMKGELVSSIAKNAMGNVYSILEEAVKILETEPAWIPITCPKCYKKDNYLPNVSGKEPCSNSRCTGQVDVGKING